MTERHAVRATVENWWAPPGGSWTFDQVKELVLPFDFELVDGVVAVRGQPPLWHDKAVGGICQALCDVLREPFTVDVHCGLIVNEETVFEPDVLVYDEEGLGADTQMCVPVARAKLVIEVVSPGTRSEDRIRKPALLAAAGVPYSWRVEREQDLPVVHEFWLHRQRGEYVPAPERPVHHAELVTKHPFAAEIDLHGLFRP